VTQRHLFPKPGIRKPFPASFPNFRDEGLTTQRALLALTRNLQRAHGWCFASEADKRKMVGEDTGHAAGVGTIPGAEDALEARGVIVILQAMPYSGMPDGSECRAGTRLTKVVLGDRERMIAREDYARRLALRRAREPAAPRPRRLVNEQLVRMPIERMLASARRPANPARPRTALPHEAAARRQEDVELARRDALDRLKQLSLDEQWSAEDLGGEPPAPKADAG
jgi:hypothetical protein